MKRQILFVDDEPKFLQGIARMLADEAGDWDLRFAHSVDVALAVIRASVIDVVVADVMMPGADGFSLLSAVRADHRTNDLPVLILTGWDDRTMKRHALDLGAVDLLNKPVCPEDLVARLRSTLLLKAYQDELKNQNALLERRVQERTADLADSQVDIIWRLGKAAEYRDEETGAHIVRVGCYPSRLRGLAIPLESRIVALADLYDALLSARPYKAPRSESEAIRIVRNERGRHLDPGVCAAFEDRMHEFQAIRHEFSDVSCWSGVVECTP